MSDWIIVSDATPLIGLAKIDGVVWLKRLFGEIWIPQAVYHEVVVAGSGKVGSEEIAQAAWIRTISVKDREKVTYLLTQLDTGEAEAIVLAKERDADWLLMDEIRGRTIAQGLGLKVIGTLGILLLAKEEGLVPEVRPLLDALMTQRFRISDFVYRQVLRQAGEL